MDLKKSGQVWTFWGDTKRSRSGVGFMAERHVRYVQCTILYARERRDSSLNVLWGKGCHGVGFKLCPASVFVLEAKSSTL